MSPGRSRAAAPRGAASRESAPEASWTSRRHCAAQIVEHRASVADRHCGGRHPGSPEQPVVTELRQRAQMEHVVEVVLDQAAESEAVSLDLGVPERHGIRARQRREVWRPEETDPGLELLQATL